MLIASLCLVDTFAVASVEPAAARARLKHNRLMQTHAAPYAHRACHIGIYSRSTAAAFDVDGIQGAHA